MFWERERYLLTILAAFLLGLESGFRHGVHGGLQHLGTSHLCAPLLFPEEPDLGRANRMKEVLESGPQPEVTGGTPTPKETDNMQASSRLIQRWNLGAASDQSLSPQYPTDPTKEPTILKISHRSRSGLPQASTQKMGCLNIDIHSAFSQHRWGCIRDSDTFCAPGGNKAGLAGRRHEAAK